MEGKIHKIYGRSLRIVYEEKDRSISIHHRNIQMLATELYKVKIGFTTSLMMKLLYQELIMVI